MSKDLGKAVQNIEEGNATDEDISIIDAKANKIEAEENLEKAVEENLKKAFANESTPDDESESAISTPDSNIESAEESTPASSESAESTVSSIIESAESTVTSGSKLADKKGLSDAYFRAAIHQGWKPEEVNNFFKKDPVLAERTLAKLYESTNKLSQEFAVIGRAKTQPTTVKKEEVKPKEFKGVDIAKLKKDYGEDEPLVELITTMQEQNKLLFDEIQDIKSSKPEVNEEVIKNQVKEDIELQKQINNFFNSQDLEGYNDLYGKIAKDAKDWDDLTIIQQSKRWELLQLADNIIVGANSQGRKMDTEEAMELAHLVVSEPVRMQVLRNELKKQVVKRSQGISLKPNNTKKMTDTSKPKSGKDLETKTAERLAKLFGKGE